MANKFLSILYDIQKTLQQRICLVLFRFSFNKPLLQRPLGKSLPYSNDNRNIKYLFINPDLQLYSKVTRYGSHIMITSLTGVEFNSVAVCKAPICYERLSVMSAYFS